MSTMMMDRTSMAMPSMTGTPTPATGMPVSPNYVMVPRCTYKFEKTKDGMKVTCVCDDAMACSMMQNLCSSLMGGMVTCCVMMNGMPVCTCNLTMGMCKVEMTKDGCCFTCTSGDPECCKMIQACCDCCATMVACGCTCCFMMNNTPVCYGCKC